MFPLKVLNVSNRGSMFNQLFLIKKDNKYKEKLGENDNGNGKNGDDDDDDDDIETIEKDRDE